MAKFTVRVELHDLIANSENIYLILHDEMSKVGFSRTVVIDQIEYELPSAEYIIEKDLETKQVAELAGYAATSTKHKYSILVTESAGRSFLGLKRVRK